MIMATELTISTMSMTVPKSDGPLLDQAGAPITSLTGDGAYD
jgi:hypothetical protein